MFHYIRSFLLLKIKFLLGLFLRNYLMTLFFLTKIALFKRLPSVIPEILLLLNSCKLNSFKKYRLYFIEHFQVYSKIKQKIEKFPLSLQPLSICKIIQKSLEQKRTSFRQQFANQGDTAYSRNQVYSTETKERQRLLQRIFSPTVPIFVCFL